jgi:hypothetical protein
MACEIVADAVSVRTIKSRKVRKEIITFALETCRRMQAKVEKRRPENIGYGHQLEVVWRILPKLRASLYICAQTSVSLLRNPGQRGKFYGISDFLPGFAT